MPRISGCGRALWLLRLAASSVAPQVAPASRASLPSSRLQEVLQRWADRTEEQRQAVFGAALRTVLDGDWARAEVRLSIALQSEQVATP